MAGETPLLSSHATMDKKYLEKVCASVPEDSMSHADDLKAEYEHSVTCYQDIMSDFAGNSFIKQYLSPAPSLAVQVTYQQTEEQLQRSAIRESAPKITLNSDFAVKGLRNGGIFSEYLEGLLTGNHPHQLRTTSKKKYIVNGAGVHLRSEKQPQYTASEKQGYSKKQSVSIGTPAFHTPVFNFAGSYQHLVGMIFTDMKNLLLSNYLGLYDTGTTGRTNEFDNVEQARFFHSKIRSRLFSKANFNQLKSIIEDPETYSVSGPQYNESLVRLRFTADGTCKLIIARDTLESRLAAQAMSKILKKRLLELNLCDADFEVPVCYYMPDTPSLHLRMYTAAEKEMDKKAAQQFLENKIIRDIKFDVFDYNLLVALDETEFSSLIDDSHLINILTTTPHLYGFFKDLGFISGDYLENTYDDMMKRLLTKESIIALFFEIKNESLQPIMRMQYIQIVLSLASFMDDNHIELFDALFNAYKKNLPLLKLSKALCNTDYDLLAAAIRHPENQYYFSKILKLDLDINAIDNKSKKTLLMTAVMSANLPAINHILKGDYNVNAVDINGLSALHYAAANNDITILKRLLDVPGININSRDKKGKTPLMYAIENDNIDQVLLLLQKMPADFDINAITENGDGILSVALKKRALSVLSYFHSKYGEYHLDVNRQNKEGDTFIHTLFKLKDFPQDALLMIFNQFVLHLPNLEITNNDGLTALEYAGKISTELLNAASLSYSSYHNFASEYAKLHEDQPESAAALLKKYKHERDAAKDTFEESPQKSTRMRM